jgi:general secretion pathway protein J
VAFAYAGQDRVWQPTWRGLDRLPSSVQVLVRDTATGRILTVSSAGKVHVNAPAGCAEPKVTKCADFLTQQVNAASGNQQQ